MTLRHFHSTLLFCLIWAVTSCSTQSSVESFADDLDFAIHEVEYNYAGFPLLTEEELAHYGIMKKAVRDSVDAGVHTPFDGVGHYLAWFQQRHLRTAWDGHNHLWKQHTPYSSFFRYDPQAASRKVDEDTYLIRFPSCLGNPDEEWIEQSVKDYKASGCKYLVLDIRGNGGGADHYFKPYLELLYDTPASVEGVDFFYTKPNFKVMSKYFPWYRLVTLFRNKSKERVFWSFIDYADIKYSSVSEYPLAAALIIDNNVGSSGEEMVLEIKASSKRTTVYGRENTYGVLDISNGRSVALPYSGLSILIPMTVSHRLPDHGIDKEGISPDVRLDIPYPTELTDNVDEWVLWIAQDLKKRQASPALSADSPSNTNL